MFRIWAIHPLTDKYIFQIPCNLLFLLMVEYNYFCFYNLFFLSIITLNIEQERQPCKSLLYVFILNFQNTFTCWLRQHDRKANVSQIKAFFAVFSYHLQSFNYLLTSRNLPGGFATNVLTLLLHSVE